MEWEENVPEKDDVVQLLSYGSDVVQTFQDGRTSIPRESTTKIHKLVLRLVKIHTGI